MSLVLLQRCKCCGEPVVNDSCGCTTGSTGGTSFCGMKVWTPQASGTLSANTITWDSIFFPSGTNDAVNSDAELAAMTASRSYCSIPLTIGGGGSFSIADNCNGTCAAGAEGYYVRYESTNGDTYEWDAMGGLPKITTTTTATTSVIIRTPGDDVYNPETDRTTQFRINSKIYKAQEGSTTYVYVNPVSAGGVTATMTNFAIFELYHENVATGGGMPTTVTSVRQSLANKINRPANITSDASIGEKSSGSPSSICAGAVTFDEDATSRTSITYAWYEAGSSIRNASFYHDGSLFTPRRPRLFEFQGGSATTYTPSNPGGKDCARFIRFVWKDSADNVLLDLNMRQGCNEGTISNAWTADGGYTLQKTGPTLWRLRQFIGFSEVLSLRMKGSGCCATDIEEGEPFVWADGPLNEPTELVIEENVIEVTPLAPFECLPCVCDEPCEPCATCAPAPETLTIIFFCYYYDPIEEEEYEFTDTLVLTKQSSDPCSYTTESTSSTYGWSATLAKGLDEEENPIFILTVFTGSTVHAVAVSPCGQYDLADLSFTVTENNLAGELGAACESPFFGLATGVVPLPLDPGGAYLGLVDGSISSLILGLGI